jgi:acetyl-CoA carboxylase biotin carboxylase subunit
VESALYDGVEVTPYYDSLLAKVTAWGRNREGARTRMKRALAEFKVVGVATNIPYLQQIIDHPDFVNGDFDTGFLDRHQVFAEEPLAEQRELAEIASLLLVTGREPEPEGTNGAAANGHRVQKTSEWRSRMTGLAATKAMGRWPKSM